MMIQSCNPVAERTPGGEAVCNSSVAAKAERLKSGDRDAIIAALRGRGLRLTVQREAVCETVFNCPGHICAEHILDAVSTRYPGLRVNKTTVYRTLDLLLELGLVLEHKCGEGRAQYEAASRGRHTHVICRGCGTLLDVDADLARTIRDALLSQHGFEAELESYPVQGLCSSCRR